MSQVSNQMLDEKLAALKSQLMKNDLLVTKSENYNPVRPSTEDTICESSEETTSGLETGAGCIQTDIGKDSAVCSNLADSSTFDGTWEIELSNISSRSPKQEPKNQDISRSIADDGTPHRIRSGKDEVPTSSMSLRTTRGEPLPILDRGFNINGVLDVRLRPTDIRTVKADALVIVDNFADDDRSGQTVDITDASRADSSCWPFKYVISTSPVTGHPFADPEVVWGELVSGYDLMWSRAAEHRISSIALSPVLGQTMSGQLTASAICRSLLNLATSPSRRCVGEIQIVDTETDVLSCIVRMFEQAIGGRGNVTITELNDGSEKCRLPVASRYGEWNDARGAGNRSDRTWSGRDPYGNRMTDVVANASNPGISDAIEVPSDANTDPILMPRQVGTGYGQGLEIPTTVGMIYDNVQINRTTPIMDDLELDPGEPTYTNTENPVQMPDRSGISSNDRQSEASTPDKVFYDNVNTTGGSPAMSGDLNAERKQAVYTNANDFNAVPEQVSKAAYDQVAEIGGRLYNKENPPERMSAMSNFREPGFDMGMEDEESKYAYMEEPYEIAFEAPSDKRETELSFSAEDTFYEEVNFKAPQRPLGDMKTERLEPEYTSVEADRDQVAAASSDPVIYDSIDEPGASKPVPVIKPNKTSQWSARQPNTVALPTGFEIDGCLKIVIYVHDVTKLKVDAIVNPTNSLLEAESSVSKSILEAAGPQLVKDLTTIIIEGGPVNETEVVETLGGSLYCRHVLHAVVPPQPTEYHSKQLQEYIYDLQKTFENVLQYANNIGARNIVLPSFISGGSNHMIASSVAKTLWKVVMVEAAQRRRHGDATLEQIHVISKSPDELAFIVKHRLDFDSQNGASTQMTTHDIDNTLKATGAGISRQPVGGGATVKDHRRIDSGSSFEPRTFKLGQYTTVVIHVCDIVKLHVDAIVSPDNGHLQHADGLAKYIYDEAGSAMMDFLTEIILYRRFLEVSEVVQTPPGKLPCRLVLHAVGPRWPNTEQASDTVYCLMQLKRTFDNVFQVARQNDVTSIAIPPIGTGACKVPAVHVAEKMYRAAVDNERRQQSVQGSVREVHFVDLEPGVLDYLVHMFENGHREAATTNVGVTTADCESSIRIDRALGGSALGNREQRIPPANPAAGQTGSARQQQTTFQHQRAQQPVAAAMPSVGAAAAGQRRVVSGVELVEPVGYLLHDDTHQIRVFVYLANVATLATDAIVNPTDDRLKHQRGISRAIAKFAGSGWRSEGQKELGSSKIPVGGVVCTGAGELPCRTVLHVVPPKWNLSDYAHSVGLSSLRRLTYTCLENVFFRAVEVGSVASVALPPVWSAKAPAPPNLMAEILFSVLLQDDNVRQLKEIHIVDTRSDFLLELKLRLDASSGVATCGLQVSPLGPEVEALVRRVMSASDSAVGDDGEVYSEIPAADNQPQKASPNIRSKIGKVTDRLAKLRIHKKQSHPNDANQAPSVLSKPGSLKSQTSYTDDRSSSSCSSSRSDIVRPDVPDRRRDPSEAPALPPRKVSPSHQNQGPTGFSPRSIPPKTDYPSP